MCSWYQSQNFLRYNMDLVEYNAYVIQTQPVCQKPELKYV